MFYPFKSIKYVFFHVYYITKFCFLIKKKCFVNTLQINIFLIIILESTYITKWPMITTA